MNATAIDRSNGTDEARLEQPTTLVWMDSREAIIVGWSVGTALIERIESDVPPHRRSTGHVRHDPNNRHGGGGSQTAGEPRRLEHLARFIDVVAERIPETDDVLVLGPGSVHERLAGHLREVDGHHRIDRTIRCERAARLTRRQLVSRLRLAMGDEPRRHTVGAYRWTSESHGAARRGRTLSPRRVIEKRSRRVEDVQYVKD